MEGKRVRLDGDRTVEHGIAFHIGVDELHEMRTVVRAAVQTALPVEEMLLAPFVDGERTPRPRVYDTRMTRHRGAEPLYGSGNRQRRDGRALERGVADGLEAVVEAHALERAAVHERLLADRPQRRRRIEARNARA